MKIAGTSEVVCRVTRVKYRIDEFRMLWLPWATHRKVWHKMEVWTATRAGWPSKRPFCAILFYASPRATKACETRLSRSLAPRKVRKVHETV